MDGAVEWIVEAWERLVQEIDIESCQSIPEIVTACEAI